MGKYYDAADVKARGTKVSCCPSGNVITLPGFTNRLVMILDNGLRKVAPDVSDPEEFKCFYDSYSTGMWLSYHLYDYQPPAPTPAQNTDFRDGDIISTTGENGYREEHVFKGPKNTQTYKVFFVDENGKQGDSGNVSLSLQQAKHTAAKMAIDCPGIRIWVA